MTPIAARVGGTVTEVPVEDNQEVEAGAVLVVIDPRDYQVALDKARAELADGGSGCRRCARQRADHVHRDDEQRVDRARRRRAGAGRHRRRAARPSTRRRRALATAQARQREAEANAAKTAKDVERFKGLLAKDEIAQQQYDAAVAAADAAACRGRFRALAGAGSTRPGISRRARAS